MILESRGLKVDKFYIPPFKLEEGEIVLLNLSGGAHYFNLKMELVNIFTGKKKMDSVDIIKPLTFVKHFDEPKVRNFFYPFSVAEYLETYANTENEIAFKIYEKDYINKKTKVKSLPFIYKRLLSICATLSKSNNIIFDLDGLDVHSSQELFEIVSEFTKSGYSAILIDWSDHFKSVCSKCISMELV